MMVVSLRGHRAEAVNSLASQSDRRIYVAFAEPLDFERRFGVLDRFVAESLPVP